MPELRRVSVLRAPADEVWARVTTFEGVNDEFRPLLRMTTPSSLRNGLQAAPVGRRAGRSWLLALGVLPVEYDDLTLVTVEPGRFLERSSMLTQRIWEHERTVADHPEGAIVTDRVAFTPRRGVPVALTAPVVALTFDHRHRRLRRRFGGRDA